MANISVDQLAADRQISYALNRRLGSVDPDFWRILGQAS